MTAAAIRPFEPADWAEARALWERTPGVGVSEADSREGTLAFLARNPGLSQVALVDGRVVATMLCGHDGRRGLIHHLATDPAHRRRGLARAMLAAGLAGLRREGIAKCHLLVYRDNPAGHAFWRAAAAAERVELSLYSISTADPNERGTAP